MSSRLKDPKRFSTLLQLPLHILLMGVGLVPFAISLYIGMTDWTPIRGSWWEAGFIGVANFISLFQDKLFVEAVGRTLLIVAVAVTAEFVIGFVFAYLLREEFFGRKNLITLILIPMMIAPVVAGYIWFLFLQTTGPMNFFLSILSGRNIEVSWLTRGPLALVSVITADIWQWTPWVFLILLSGFLSVPQDPIDAARVLGASEWQVLRHITMPFIRPVILIALLLRSIEAIKIFDTAYIMTGGGPGYATQTLSLYLFEEGFRYMKLGYVGGASVLIFVVMMLVSYVIIKRTGLW